MTLVGLKMIRILLLVMCLSSTFVTAQQKPLVEVTQLQWTNRVLLIWTEDVPSAKLEIFDDEINDRDLVWFQFSQSGVLSNYQDEISKGFWRSTNNKYYEQGTKVLLIGKDGGVKNRYSSLDLPSVFQSIDVMPMRQYEMRNEPSLN